MWNLASDWITSDDSVIAPMVKEAAAKHAAEKKITIGCMMSRRAMPVLQKCSRVTPVARCHLR